MSEGGSNEETEKHTSVVSHDRHQGNAGDQCWDAEDETTKGRVPTKVCSILARGGDDHKEGHLQQLQRHPNTFE